MHGLSHLGVRTRFCLAECRGLEHSFAADITHRHGPASVSQEFADDLELTELMKNIHSIDTIQ